MSLKTPLARVRGLGSAKDGTHHFWWQRLTGIALVPLVVWMMVAVLSTTLGDYASAHSLIAHPVAAVLAVCAIITVFHHGQLGLQVVIEDYVHVEWVKIASLIAVKFAAVVLALLGIVAVLRIAVGS